MTIVIADILAAFVLLLSMVGSVLTIWSRRGKENSGPLRFLVVLFAVQFYVLVRGVLLYV